MARVPASTAGDESVTQPRYTARWASQSLRIASRLDQPTVLRLFRLGSRIASYDHGLPTMSGTKPSDSIGRPSDRRKLIAVVYADMVGYSRLIGLDDTGTLERLRRIRKEVVDPAIEEHGGRVVNTGGDSLLVEFDSVVGAVRCAIQVQRRVPELHDEPSPDRAI